MTIHNEIQAIQALEDKKNHTGLREEAARFLEENLTENAMQHLINALTDDDFGVRWAASSALAKLGDRALPALLQAMIKDTSPRLRESVYHVLHYNQDRWVQWHSKPLMDAIKSIAPDVAAPQAAYQMLKEFNSRDNHGSHDNAAGNTPLESS